MIRSFKYRLRPTERQERVLLLWLTLTRELYNAALQERRGAWEKAKQRVTWLDQSKALKDVRGVRPEFQQIPVVVLRGAIRRIDKAFQAFFRRCKGGSDKPGYPRFRSARRWDSLLIDDLGQCNPCHANKKRVRIPKLGLVKIDLHRPLEGTPKAMRIKRDRLGRWWVTFACVDVPDRPLAKTGVEVGIDVGLIHFAATSDGDLFENPRPLRVAECELRCAHRSVSRKKRGSNRRKKAVRILARKHERIQNIRREHHITVAKALVAAYDVICVEKLNIKGLAASRLAKSVHDAGWGNFLHWLRTKAEEAGREVVEVDPRGTSQTCPSCERVQVKPLSQRVHDCPCGLRLDRDVAAAQVVLRRGTRLRGGAPGCRTPMIREVRVAASAVAN